MKKLLTKLCETIFLVSAVVSVLSLLAIAVFMFIKGGPAILEIGPWQFLTGKSWQPEADIYGILPMIIGSVYATLGAMIIGIPIGILTGIFLAEIVPDRVANKLRPMVELMAGIPSVVYGFFGLVVIVPWIYSLGGPGNQGNSLLAAIIILSVMVLPTIINITESSLRQVPRSYIEGSLAMGATKIRTIFGVQIRAAKSGIFSGVMLGIGRAIGETMAVLLVAGNTALIPTSLFSSVRTLTTNVALEMSYAFGLHEEALFATGVVLFVLIMILNVILYVSRGKAVGKE